MSWVLGRNREPPNVPVSEIWTCGPSACALPRPGLTRHLELGFEEQPRPERTAQARHGRHALIVKRLEVRRRLAQERRSARDVVPVIRVKLVRTLRRWFARDHVIDFRQDRRDVLVARVLALERAQIGDAELGNRDARDAPRKLHRDRRGLTLDVGGHEIERPIGHERPADASAAACRTSPAGGFPNASLAVRA